VLVSGIFYCYSFLTKYCPQEEKDFMCTVLENAVRNYFVLNYLAGSRREVDLFLFFGRLSVLSRVVIGV
jgi:hypothetical protein